MKAYLALEDGTLFEGISFGAEGEASGEVIFNTQVVGYQEILTDPANRGRIVAMGYPHIGNYGINDRCFESDRPQVSAFVVKEYSKVYSNWQAKGSLGDLMKTGKVVGIEGVDTRALTLHLRDHGEMKGIVSTETFDRDKLVEKIKGWKPEDKFPETRKLKVGEGTEYLIVDIGVNNTTLDRYAGAEIVSPETSAEEILEKKPKQVIISSGPGDPRKMTALIGEVKKLAGKVPVYGIQNGACVLAMALGCGVEKMKVGHHGVNHPVVDPKTGRGEISIQNHSYGIVKPAPKIKVTHVNLNDKSIEKIESSDGLSVGTLYFPIDERGKLPAGYKFV